MKYPPNFKGFLRALFDTLRGKKLKPGIPEDEHGWNINDYEVYEPGKDPGMEFWQAEADKLAERKATEQAEAERQMIHDYELEHAEDKPDDFHADMGIDFDMEFDEEFQ